MAQNPPAFPSPSFYAVHGRGADAEQPGMTLRDHFAGQALISVLSSATNLGESTKEERAAVFSQVAEILYEIADAMLAERAKEPGQ
jgi:hypothetical protein